MISTLEKEITLRYLKTRKKDGFLNIISIFSFIGISLGVAVLIIVMSVMNGFRTELINKIVGFNAHVTVKPYEQTINKEKLDNYILKLISKELIFSNSGEAIVINKEYTKGLVLRGYDNKDFSKLDVVKKGNLIGNSNQLIKNYISIGKELSFNLKLAVGDKISIMSSSGIETIIGTLPKQETFIISSIFDSGLADFDQNIAFINLKTLENFFDLKKEIDFNRFEQELIYYLEKIDINEELVRLKNHLIFFKKTVNEKQTEKGKKLIFISQEIGREINTIGSKSNYLLMQKIVVEMKNELEKMKEQLLNVL